MFRQTTLLCILFLFTASICNSSELEALFAQGNDLLVKENFQQALEIFESALKLSEQQKDQAKTANALYKMGVCLNSLARYDEAFKVLARAEEIHTTLGVKEALAFDLTEIANTELLRANANKSISILENALQLHREVGSRKGESDTLRIIGLAYVNKGDFQKASGYVENSLSISREIQDEWGIAMSLKDQGIIHFRAGELQQALESLQKGLEIAKKIKSKKIQSRIVSGLAMVYDAQGDRKGQIGYLTESINLAKDIGDKLQECIVQLNTGATYYDMNEFSKSYDAFLKATTIAEEIGNKRLAAGAMIGIAMVHRESGDNDTALNYLRKAAKVNEEVGDKFSLTYALNELGSAEFESGDYASALKYHEHALRIRKESNDKEGIAYTMNYIGETYYKLGDLDRAMESFKEGLAISEANGLINPMSNLLTTIATVQYDKKEMAEALKTTEKAIELAKQNDSRADQWHALHIQAKIFRDTGKTTEAAKAFRDTVDVIESIRSDFELPESRAGYLSARLGAYEDLIDVMLKDDKVAEAFEYVQRSKARAFLDTLAEMRVETSTTLSEDLRERKENVINQLVEVQTKIHEEEQKENVQKAKLHELEKKRLNLEEQYSNVLLEIRRQNPQVAEAQYPQPTSLQQVQTLLDDQSVLLEYFVGESSTILFGVTHNDAKVYHLPGEQKLSKQISLIRDTIQKPDQAFQFAEQSHSKFVQTSENLHSELISPANALIEGKKRVVISPDGPLHYLPFECLLTGAASATSPNFAKLPYFAREYDIQYVPSVSVFFLFAKRKNPSSQTEQKQLLAFADPAFGDSSKSNSLVREWVGKLGALPFTRPEVEGIARLYPSDKTSVFIGSQASEKNLKKLDLQQYKFVHFASHGLIDEEKPQFSSLILSHDASDDEDGYLTVREVFDLKLNADLVVLSACKTGLGKRIRGEGVSGLSRAFLCAGTPSVLVSLWNVYDRSTAEFMKMFYENMEKQKLNKAEALKEARLQMIQNPKYSHPYYWASFVLIGNN